MTTIEKRPPETDQPRLAPPGDLAHYFALHETDPWPTTLADVVNDDGRNTQYERLVTRLTADAPATTKATIRESAAYLLGREVGRQMGRGNTSGLPIDLIDLIDRADRVRYLLEFVAGYAMLVDVCEDGATIDTLKTGYLGLPLLDAAKVVEDLEACIVARTQTTSDETGGDTAAPAA